MASPRPNAATVIRRSLILLAALALIWAAVIAITGGFLIRIGSWRISSRQPWQGISLALICLLLAWGLSIGRLARTPLRADFSWWAERVRDAGMWCRRHAFAILAIAPALVMAATVISITGAQWLAAQPLWLDEEMIALNIRDRSFAELTGTLWLGQTAPLGWLAIQRVALLTLGVGEVAMRVVPWLFGVASIVAAIWIGRRWTGAFGTAVFVLLCSFGPLVVHYFLELKHYSADAFFGLLLPALVVWALEGPRPQDRRRRAAVWWVVAAVGQWLAYGALFAAPACALVLCLALWRRDGPAAAAWCAGAGTIWLACFALHYMTSIGSTHQSTYLRGFWASEMPAATDGIADRVRWVWNRLALLAANPGGTERWMLFWSCAIGGFIVARRRWVGVAFATLPASAFILGAAGIVPLHERFSLWIAPALYAGIALGADRVAAELSAGWRVRRWLTLASALMAAVAIGVVTADIFRQGRKDMVTARPTSDNHLLDDRAAVKFLLSHRRPGEPIITTRLGWPALWWHANIRVDDAGGGGGRHPDGGMFYEVTHRDRAEECDGRQPLDLIDRQSRVLIYLGFPDFSQGFAELLLHHFDRAGAIVAFETYSARGLAAVINLTEAPAREATSLLLERSGRATAVPLGGCVAMQPARRW